MARGKPIVLSKKAGDLARARAKTEKESFFGVEGLPARPPGALKGCPVGRAAWRALVRMQERMTADLFHGLDVNFITSFCLALEQRSRAKALERDVTQAYSEGKADLADLLKTRVELRMTIRLVGDLARGLYSTPMSRAAFTPPSREATPEELVEHELDELNRLMGES